MPILVLLNGPPASGKSTIAAHLIARRPLALNLDIDVIRALLGDWKARPADAGIAARRLRARRWRSSTSARATTCSCPSSSPGPTSSTSSPETAATAGARFVEIALLLSRADAIAAFERRSRAPATTAHRDAAEAVEHAGGPKALATMYDDFAALLQGRHSAHRVDVRIGDIDGTVAAVESAIDSRMP